MDEHILENIKEIVLTDNEVYDLLHSTRCRRDFILLYLILETGIDISDICNLTVGDVLDMGNTIRIENGNGIGKYRYINTLSDKFSIALIEYKEGIDSIRPLFLSNKGKNISISQVYVIFKNALYDSNIQKKCNIKILSQTYEYNLKKICIEKGIPYVKLLEKYKTSWYEDRGNVK